MSKLIFCESCTLYKKIDKRVLWDCYITSSLDECIKYIYLYSPKSITVSNQMLDSMGEIIRHIKKAYKTFPSIFIYASEGIIDSLNDEVAKRQILRADKIPLKTDIFINNILLKYGFSPKLKGYSYIKRALYEGLSNESVYTNIKKILYPNIASLYLASCASVERSISFCILKAYEKNENMKEIFNNCDHAPSNLIFLKHFYFILKKAMSEYEVL